MMNSERMRMMALENQREKGRSIWLRIVMVRKKLMTTSWRGGKKKMRTSRMTTHSRGNEMLRPCLAVESLIPIA